MTLQLSVNGDRWRAHLRSTAARTPGLVPVAKGNGYGFTVAGLARRTQWLADALHKLDPDTARLDTIAVGTYGEVPEVATRFQGSILVLEPWRRFSIPHDGVLPDDRVIHTVGRIPDLVEVLAHEGRPRIVLERRTSMLRHGFDARELREAARLMAGAPRARLEGVAFHLPLGSASHLSEVHRLMTDVVAAGLYGTVWVSHLSAEELAQLRTTYADFAIRPRVGTALWLGARDALKVTSTVLDVHEVERGDAFGYRGRTAPKAGHILVVSGGTAHGIGLEAPTGELSLKARASTIARGGLDAVGFVRSPFTIDGKQRLFAEPPHMQASMLFLPHGTRVPAVGEQISVRVRHTTTIFDRVVIS